VTSCLFKASSSAEVDLIVAVVQSPKSRNAHSTNTEKLQKNAARMHNVGSPKPGLQYHDYNNCIPEKNSMERDLITTETAKVVQSIYAVLLTRKCTHFVVSERRNLKFDTLLNRD